MCHYLDEFDDGLIKLTSSGHDGPCSWPSAQKEPEHGDTGPLGALMSRVSSLGPHLGVVCVLGLCEPRLLRTSRR